MQKTKQSSPNSNGSKTKRSFSSSKKSASPQNGHLSVSALRLLKREYLAAETKEARAKVLKPLPKEEQWELILKWYKSLRTGKAEDHFLSLLSSADLHALVVGMIHERPQNMEEIA
ncbi:MAG: hypothetical protein ABI977_05505 [Acidobacteriota bacterium]